jgi:hypothetical protein
MALCLITNFWGGGRLGDCQHRQLSSADTAVYNVALEPPMVSIATDWLVTPQRPASLAGVVVKVVVLVVAV